MDRKNERRNFFKAIKEAFEFKTVRMMFTAMILAFAALLAIGYTYFFWRQVFSTGEPIPLLLQRLGELAKILLLAFFVTAILVCWLTVILAIRIIGPLKRLERGLLAMANDEIPETLKFRYRDEIEFHLISIPFNDLIEKMKRKKNGLNKLRVYAKEIKETAEKRSLKKAQIVDLIRQFEENIQEIVEKETQ